MKKIFSTVILTGALIAFSAVPAFAETGWVNTNGNYYYYDSSGAMCKGWAQINGSWYYFGPNYGSMQTGLLTIDNQLYYFNSDGIMQTGTTTLPDGVTYSFDTTGPMISPTGWQLINGSYYYFENSSTIATGWKKVGGYYVNSDGQRMENVLSRGIDVSRYQNDIDWRAVAQDDVAFAIIRVGSVKYGVDAKYHANMKAANENGIKTGIYVYSYATTPEAAREEAAFVLSNIQDYQVSFPIAFDVEDSVHKALSPSELADIINAFCEVIEQNGYHPIIYSSKSWYLQRIDTTKLLNRDKWVAQYYTECEYPGASIWQATSSGSINGIEGRVDVDFQYKDYNGIIVANGWAMRGKDWFYFRDYRKQTGWIFADNKYYYLNAAGAMQTGWLQQNGSWYYLQKDGAMQVGWADINDNRYYFDSSGIMKSGWTEINGSRYLFNPDGALITGWHLENNQYFYLSEADGAMSIGFTDIGENTYYFDEAGIMQSAWTEINGKWYLFSLEGVMRTGWITDSGNRYYFNPNGSMAVEWLSIDDSWYYFGEDGIRRSGWTTVNDKLYYLDAEGRMQTGWIGRKYLNEDGSMQTGWKVMDGARYYFKENGDALQGWFSLDEEQTWYYAHSDGKLQLGFADIGNSRYYFEADGKMVTGWLQLGNDWYYFNESGAMAVSTSLTIEGVSYQFDETGKWIQG